MFDFWYVMGDTPVRSPFDYENHGNMTDRKSVV